jgi:oxalate decarboxylase
MSDEKKDNSPQDGFSRRSVLGIGSAALAAAALTRFSANAQTLEGTLQAQGDHSSSNPGQELNENPNSNTPPPTDHGDVGPIWYSYDLTHQRIQEGGWTHQVTQRELPSSTDIAGVNMRLTAGSFRELHWHTVRKHARQQRLTDLCSIC